MTGDPQPGPPPAPQPADAPAPRPHRARFRLGLWLMIVSFALYPLYAVLLELPLARVTKVYVGFAAWGASWASFALGSALAGKEGAQYLRQAFWRRRNESKTGSDHFS